MNLIEIITRLGMAGIIGGAIGYEREYKNRPAGFRTHILVCIGAAIIAMIQVEIYNRTIYAIMANPDLIDVLRTDISRMSAQVISGIGFLGAGTILHNRGSVKGLTTAASLWVIACLGIAVGYGYYLIAAFGTVFCIIVLVILKKLQYRIFIDSNEKKIQLSYYDRKKSVDSIEELFLRKNIRIMNIEFPVEKEEYYDGKLVSNTLYTIITPKTLTTMNIITMVSKIDTITGVKEIVD